MRIPNISDLADRSDYRVEAMETTNKLTGGPARRRMHSAYARPQAALLAKACHEILKSTCDDSRKWRNRRAVEVHLAIGINESIRAI